MSILFLGFGQLYNGQLKKAVLFFVFIFPLIFFIGYSGLVKSFNGLITGIFLTLAYMAFVLYDAVKWAVKQKDYQLQPVNTLKYYLGFIIAWYILTSVLTPLTKKAAGFEAFKMPTPSMEPSIAVGDLIMATTVDPKDIQAGDIITFIKDDGQYFMSRAIGLPGDKIEIIDDKVSINGQIEKWEAGAKNTVGNMEYQAYQSQLPNGKTIGTLKMLKFNGMDTPVMETSNKEALVIPENQVFVLGDNRNNSMDSRMYGTIPFKNIDKKVHYVWWSNDFGRIGMKLHE